jgi:hypothetical protein
MTNSYSSALDKAKDEYWLNQDRIPMDTNERIERHRNEILLATLELLEKMYKELQNENIQE